MPPIRTMAREDAESRRYFDSGAAFLFDEMLIPSAAPRLRVNHNALAMD
jgi:hypothetical protein